MKKITLSIPEPCDKKWAELTETGQFGCRFCDRCEKQIRDFTHSTDAEIAYQFHKNAGKICGKFRPDQLGRPIQIGAQNSVFGKAAGLIFGGMLAAFKTEAQSSRPTQLVERLELVSPSKCGNISPDGKTDLNKRWVKRHVPMNLISGKIVDVDTKEPLVGISVRFQGNNKFGALSNVDGSFSIYFSDEIQPKNRLTFQSLDHRTVSYEIPNIKSGDELTINIEMKRVTQRRREMLGGICFEEDPPPFREKIPHFLKRIF